MGVDARHDPGEDRSIAAVTVQMEHNGRGRWEVSLPNHERITCETIDVARRAASLSAAQAKPCELIVHDAYHRVLHHELVTAIAD